MTTSSRKKKHKPQTEMIWSSLSILSVPLIHFFTFISAQLVEYLELVLQYVGRPDLHDKIHIQKIKLCLPFSIASFLSRYLPLLVFHASSHLFCALFLAFSQTLLGDAIVLRSERSCGLRSTHRLGGNAHVRAQLRVQVLGGFLGRSGLSGFWLSGIGSGGLSAARSLAWSIACRPDVGTGRRGDSVGQRRGVLHHQCVAHGFFPVEFGNRPGVVLVVVQLEAHVRHSLVTWVELHKVNWRDI